MIEFDRQLASFVAGETFASTDLGKAVNIDATDSTDQSLAVEFAGAGEVCLGVLKSFEAAGKTVAVAYAGAVTALAGAAIAENEWVKVGTGSKFIPVASNNDQAFGFALSIASADGEFFLLMINRCFYGA